MNTAQYKALTEIFLKVCDLPPGDRTAYLNEACGDDRELRQELEKMLKQDGRELPVPVPVADDAVAGALRASDPFSHPDVTDLPDSIGHFRVIELIAHGGMGIVYRAEQESPKREVALKVIHPELASPQVVARFENEAHVLGQLQHTGIAQIYEAGVAEIDLGHNRTRKQPFFAMEYIRGEQLNRYAATGKLGFRDKLQLFARICDAVDHAHQRGIIHRDLKPANILVDSSGQPKILDFGVARVTDSELQSVTLQTNVGQLVGTLPYMSPEQVSGRSDDLDARSDVYALGVLLFELLSGKLPYDVRQRSIPEAARIIQEDEPTSLGDCDTTYRGDVETIAMKALEKEKSRRYATAAELADDIRRYLADEPITARAPSSFYHVRKFAKRNKAIVGGVIATVLALAAGLVFSINFALDAKRHAAETEWTAYTLGIHAARASIATDPNSATRDLDVLPEALRNWEWHHLHAQLDAAVASCAGEGIISSAAFLTDGTPVAALIQSGAVTLVDVTTCETLRDFGPAPKLAFLELSPDGAWLGGYDLDRLEISIWSVADGCLVNRMPVSGNQGASVIEGGSGLISGLRFSADGGLCFSLGKGRSGVFNTQSGQFRPFKDAIDASLLESTSSILLGEGGDINRIKLQSGSVVKGDLGRARISCLASSPDGNAIAVGTVERVIHLLDGQLTDTGTTLSGHGARITDVLFLQDDVLASASTDGTVRIWDLSRQVTTRALMAGAAGPSGEASGKTVSTSGADLITGSAVILAVSPARNQILSSRRNEVTLLDLEAGSHRLLTGHSSYAYFATHSPDGTLIASFAWDNKVILWDAFTGTRLATMPFDESTGYPRGLAFAHDRRHVMAMTSGTYGVWDVATGQRIENATDSGAQSVRLRQIKETQPQSEFCRALFHEQAGGGARSTDRKAGQANNVSDDGTLLVQGKSDGRIVISTRKDMTVLSTLEVHETAVVAVAISADNTLIVSADEESVRLWDRARGREIARLSGLGGKTFCLDFSPDGTRLVSAGEDGVIRLWDTGSYKLAAELKGHGNYVHSVLFSPDGTQLVSASGDHSVRLWDTVSRGKRLKQAQAAATLREEMTPIVDGLLNELVEPAMVAAHLRSDTTIDESHRRAALRVLLSRSTSANYVP